MSILEVRRAAIVAAPCALCALGAVGTKAQSKLAVSVGGLRVVGPGIGESGSEQRPFNESTGTTIVLMVRAPKGTGIVDLDNDGSVIDTVSDDKGTNLLEDASFGSFPEVVKDGSAGLIELKLGARPGAGATSVAAEGSLNVTTATGTKPVKSASVALVEGKTFKVGTIPITVGKVEASEDSISVTFNLPRAALKTIKAMKFLDAKGGEIEGDRRGSGYLNETGELDYQLKTTSKTVTVSCDVWQGLKSDKLPFKVTASLGL